METEDWQQARRLLVRNWGLKPDEGWADRAALLAALEAQVRHMLADEFERLVQTMYRLDVSEARFRQALALPDRDQQAAALATVIWERELQRLETWQKYSGPR